MKIFRDFITRVTLWNLLNTFLIYYPNQRRINAIALTRTCDWQLTLLGKDAKASTRYIVQCIILSSFVTFKKYLLFFNILNFFFT